MSGSGSDENQRAAIVTGASSGIGLAIARLLGEEGYGLWLDPAIQDNAIYAEHWAGHRPVEVTIEEDRIVIRRVGEDD